MVRLVVVVTLPVMSLTTSSLPPTSSEPAEVVEIYAGRWSIELC